MVVPPRCTEDRVTRQTGKREELRSVAMPSPPNTKSPAIMFALRRNRCDRTIMKPMPALAPTISARMIQPQAHPMVIRSVSKI